MFVGRCTTVYTGLILGVTVTISLAGFGFPNNNDELNPHIPQALSDCYNSTYITTRDNLLPMTVNTLIALIRKIEDVAGGSFDIRTLSSALLTSYRFDGIMYSPRIDPRGGIPYVVEGDEFSLWKLLYDKVIAKTGIIVPNDTLSWIERCTLHRMLSMSVDVYGTEDPNNCPRVDNTVQSWNRYPREISKLSDVEMIPPKLAGGESRIVNENSEDQIQSGNFMLDTSGNYPPSRCPIENGVILNKYGGTLSPGIVLAGIAAGSQPQFINPSSLLFMQPRSGGGLRKKVYSGNNNPNPNYSNNPGYPNNPSYPNNPGYPNNPRYPSNTNNNYNAYGNPRSRTFSASQFDYGNNNNNNNNNGGPYGNSGGPNNPNSGGRNPGYPGGSYPGGSMGGGYGGPNNPQGRSDQNKPVPPEVNNKFAATLAGELGFIAAFTGPLKDGMQIGLDGGWNDTAAPKYYFQSYMLINALTDARIRGSIDGLLLASNVENWINSFRTLKLSQLLSMYYSTKGVFSSDVKSCKRRDYYQQLAFNLKDQSYAMAYALEKLAPFESPALYDHTVAAAEILGNYIPTLKDPPCPQDDNSYTPKPSPVVDLYLVLDYNWDYAYVSRVIQYIVDNIELWKYGGNFTLINAKDGSVVVESSPSPLDFVQNFTYYYGNGGFDFTRILSQLKVRFQDKLEYDKQQNSPGGIPRVVVFMPYSSSAAPGGGESYSAQNRIQYFRSVLPDVKFYYLVAGNKNSFAIYAEDPDKDIFVITQGSDIPSTLNPFINRLITTPRRIINPNCGKNWQGTWYNEVTLNGYLSSGEIHYYRIHPNYFFKGANARISVSTDVNAPILNICTSRNNPLPIGNLTKSGSVTCQQLSSGKPYDMYVKDTDCNSVYYATQCKPFYFSIANQQPPSKTQIVATCTDQECRDPDMTKYVIKHSGLSCYSGVSKLVMSLPALLLSIIIHYSYN